MDSIIVTRCGLQLPVRKEGAGFVTAQVCPNNVATGTAAMKLLSTCKACPYGNGQALPAQPAAGLPATEETAPPAAPEPPQQPQPEAQAPTPPPAIPEPPQPAPVELPPQPPTGAEPKVTVVRKNGDGTETPIVPPATQETTPPPAPEEPAGPPPTPPPPKMTPTVEEMNGPVPTTAQPPSPLEHPNVSPPTQVSTDVLNQFQGNLSAADELAVGTLAPAELEKPKGGGVTITSVELVEHIPPPADSVNVLTAEEEEFDIGDIVMPDGTKFMPDDEASVDIDAAMATIDGMVGGPSEGGYSSHVLGDFDDCPYRAHLKYVCGLKPRKPKIHFAWGSLFHACLAMKYQYGQHRMIEPIEAAIKAGAPGMAREVRDVVDMMHKKYSDSETKTWCPRAIEHNAIFWTEPVKINGKLTRIPISMRIDLILALKKQNEACPGLGPAAQGCYVVDHKTTSNLTIDLMRHFSNDWQLKLYAMGYVRSGLAEQFGKLQGVMVNIAVKRKKLKDDHFFREWVSLRQGALEEFYYQEVLPNITRMHELLSDPDRARQPENWPKRTRSCVGKFGPCDFLPLCDAGPDFNPQIDYIVDEHQIMFGRLDEILKPPPKGSMAKTVDAAVALEKQQKKANKALIQNLVTEAFARSVLGSNQPPWNQINKEAFLVEGHTEKGVKKELTDKLKEITSPHVVNAVQYGQKVPGLPEGDGVMLKFVKSGLQWTYTNLKGTSTWKQIADKICEVDWFNLENL